MRPLPRRRYCGVGRLRRERRRLSQAHSAIPLPGARRFVSRLRLCSGQVQELRLSVLRRNPLRGVLAR